MKTATINKPMSEKVKPYNPEAAKKEQIADMFDNIAHSYDFLNHFFSLGIDNIWRKKAVRLMKKDNPDRVMDMATGTGDFAIQTIKLNGAKHVIGVDISKGMLEIGKKKIRKKGLSERIEMHLGDSENLEFADGYFDAYTVGYGVRNFQNLKVGLAEMRRVLKPGGKGFILELSEPRKFPMRQLFLFYFRFLMPLMGRLVSKDHRAYSYLPESVAAFPEGEIFADMLRETGYDNVQVISLSGGISTLYIAQNPE